MNANVKLSYEAHDGSELELMLSGLKPMSFFMHSEDEAEWFKRDVSSKFHPHVQSGRIKAFDSAVFYSGVKIVVSCYTVPGEEWRANALFLLQKSLVSCKSRMKWSEGMERMLGELLGYEEWQINEYIDRNMNSYI